MTTSTFSPSTPSVSAASSDRWDLVGRLQRLVTPGNEDRAALAALRRSLGKQPGYSAEVARIVQPVLPDDASYARTEAHYLVASLFGLLPRHFDTPEDPKPRWAQQGLGWSLRGVRFREDGEPDRGIERRFVALLDAEADALADHLRHLIKLAMSRDDGFALDFRRLLRDILAWDADDRRVQRQWAAGFWSGGPRDTPNDDVSNGADANNDDD